MSTELSQQFSQVGTFLEAIEPLLPAYRYGLLSYVAVVHEGEPVVLRAGVRFSMADALPRRINRPTSLRAGQKGLCCSPIAAWSVGLAQGSDVRARDHAGGIPPFSPYIIFDESN